MRLFFSNLMRPRWIADARGLGKSDLRSQVRGNAATSRFQTPTKRRPVSANYGVVPFDTAVGGSSELAFNFLQARCFFNLKKSGELGA